MKLFTSLIASCFLLLATGIEARADLQKILEVKTTGLQRIERDAILEKISSKPGKAYMESDVRRDIESLYGMGYFDDIEIRKEGTAASGVTLTFAFTERPVISDIDFEGNEKINTSDLEEVIKVKKWSILDVNKARADVELLQKHYEDKGYYLARVSYEVRKSKDGEVKLVYKVFDYDKVEIKQIVFLNNHAYTDEKLKNIFAETKEGSSMSFLSSSGTFKEASFKVDLQRLTYFYLENGYLKFRYENPIITVSDDKKYVYISTFMDEGVPYKIGSYDFSGDLLFAKDELKNEVKLLEGQTFSITGRNADIQRLTEKYQDLGYAFVNVIPKMDFNDEAKTVAVDYSFEKGNLVHFNEIRVVGNTKTYDKVIRRELRIHEGELFNGTNLRISKERVERLGYFAPGEVQFNQVPVRGSDDKVDIEIVIKERSTGSITLGAGFSSVQGFFFQGKIQEINLLGRGQSLSFETQWGKDDLVRSFNLEFMDPYAFDTNWSAGFSLFMTNSPIPDRYLIRRSGFNLKFGYPLSDYVQGYLTYKFENLRILTKYSRAATGNAPEIDADTSLDIGNLSSVVLSVVRDKRNNRFETTGGNYQNLSVEFAGIGGVKNFSKVTFNNRYYNNFIGNFVFKNSTEFGAMINTSAKGIPPAEKFYLGGPWNMRGFDAFSLSPVIPIANRPNAVEKVGGAAEVYSLFEIEHPLIKEAGLKWVMFYDVGNTFMSVPVFSSGQDFNLKQNWGFGFRWFSPLGPLRFEWGFPIHPGIVKTTNLPEASPQFIFFIGQPF